MIQGSERQCCLVFLPILAKTWPETTPLKTKHLFKTRFGLDTKIHHSVIWLDWVMFGEKLIIYIKFWVYERHHFLGGHILSPNSRICSLKNGPFFSDFALKGPQKRPYISAWCGVSPWTQLLSLPWRPAPRVDIFSVLFVMATLAANCLRHVPPG